MTTDFASPNSQTPAEVAASGNERKLQLEDAAAFCKVLLELEPAKFARLNVSVELANAIQIAREIPPSGARNRQMKKVRQYLSECDLEDLRRQVRKVDHLRAKKQPVEPELSETERLAEALLFGGDKELFTLADRFPREDLARIRTIVRNAQRRLRDGAPRDLARREVTEVLIPRA